MVLLSVYLYIGNLFRYEYACILLLSFSWIFSVNGQQQGDLRFRGSFADGVSGRLEIFIDNEWGTICSDGFTERSADTACRQLGSAGALTFGEADKLGYVNIMNLAMNYVCYCILIMISYKSQSKPECYVVKV